MPRVTLDNGRAIEVQDESSAALLQDALQRLTDKANDAAAKASKAQESVDAMQAQLDAKDAELNKAKEATSDKSIAARMKEVEAVKDRARKIAGKDFSCDSIEPLEIKRAALADIVKDAANKPEAYINVAFDMAEEKAEEAEDEEEKEKKKSNDSLSRLAASLSNPTQDGEKVSAKDAYTQALESAWKSNREGA